MFAFTNTTGQTITNFTVSFDYLRFRTNSTAISNLFYFSGSSTSWGSAISTNTWSTGTSGYNFAPTAVSLSNTIALSITNGGVGYMLWTFDATSGTGSQGLGLDNVSINTPGGPTGSGTLGISEAGAAIFSGAITNNTAATLTAESGGTAIFSGVISGAGSVTKTGAGTVVLSAPNTYTGSTAVIAGMLLVNGDQSSALGTFSISAGASAGGSGTIGGAVEVNGTLAPGSSIESLAMGALSFSNGATFAVELNSSVAASLGADLVVANGNLNLESLGTITLSLEDIAASPVAFAVGTKFSLINYTGAWNGGLFTYASTTLTDGATFDFGLNTWGIDYNATVGGANFADEYSGDNFVNIEVIPEPSTYALLGFAAAGLGAHLVRRRRQLRILRSIGGLDAAE
jgi:autotransporter-associated beta strand protein